MFVVVFCSCYATVISGSNRLFVGDGTLKYFECDVGVLMLVSCTSIENGNGHFTNKRTDFCTYNYEALK